LERQHPHIGFVIGRAIQPHFGGPAQAPDKGVKNQSLKTDWTAIRFNRTGSRFSQAVMDSQRVSAARIGQAMLTKATRKIHGMTTTF
jgi:hypothetical protein